jgi:hypothetical protein
MLDKTSKLPYLLQLPQELRDLIYSFTVSENKLILEYNKEVPRLWELRVSHLPDSTNLLHVSSQVSADYKQFCLDTFSKSKILISTNALTSALPTQFSEGRPRALLELVPNLIIQASADWKWWIGFTSASFPLALEEELLPNFSPRSSIELICRLVGRSIFIPGHLGSSRTEGNLRSFFSHKIPLPRISSLFYSPSGILKGLKITKTLILEREPLSDIFGAGAATGLPGFREHLNKCGATFPETDKWTKICEVELEPILQWTLAPPGMSTPLSDAGHRFVRGEARATVCQVLEE